MSSILESGATRFEQRLLDRWVGTLVRLRWLSVTAIAAAVVLAVQAHLLRSSLPLWLTVGGMAAYNLAVAGAARTRWAKGASVAQLQGLILAQLLLDTVSLALILHFSDSVENPFVMFFVFPVAAAALLLPKRLWVAVTLTAALVHGSGVLLEHLGVLQHHPLAASHLVEGADPMFRSNYLLAGYLVALVLTLNGLAYFVYVVGREHRRAESLRFQHEHVAVSRERLARVGQIAAGVAHSVRNPLHGLINSVDLLAGRLPEDPRTTETLGLMSEGLSHIESVTQRLLVLSRDAPLCRQQTPVDELVTDALRLFSSPGGARGVDLKVELGGVGSAAVDSNQLGEALANVVENAFAACSPGEAVLVTTASQDGAGTVSIEVRDTGAGIPADQVAVVFDPFFTTKAVGEGTGLGLAITRRVLEAHGGSVVLRSEVGLGTTVRLVLPRSQPDGPIEGAS